jgi:hypothetical protein
MGELFIHDLKPYIDKYRCTTFVETGTGVGTGVIHALKHEFKKLYSIEIMEELWTKCKQNIKDDRVELLNCNSLDGLEKILEEVKDENSVFFWLDAHFPGADFHFNDYDHLKDQPHLHMPLRNEIELIKKARPDAKDVFIIDDLQIYEDGPFELLNQPFKDKYGELGIEFITEAYETSHNFARDYRHQGFLILTPNT